MMTTVTMPIARGTALVWGQAQGPVLASDLELSFWGGVDPTTGEVIDRHHPLSGQWLAGRILVIPGGRGSCSGSGVMLELLLNGHGPAALVFERPEDILTLGVIVAEELFATAVPVLVLPPDSFRALRQAGYAAISGDQVMYAGQPVTLTDLPPTGPAPQAGARLDLTADDRACLAGQRGQAAQAALRMVVRMAGLQGADRLMDVTQVHVDGCIYTGPGSLAFAERLRDWGGRVAVPTSLNSLSVDHRRWRAQGIDPALGEPAARLGDAYVAMGARPTFTCAPYLLDTAPVLGEQIAWAESNAVVYANSVLGARTMKYPDFLDIAIALTGRAPCAGPHRDEHRRATVEVTVTLPETTDDAFWPLLGYAVGGVASSRIPVVTGVASLAPSSDDLKAFGAAFATVSAAPMFHIAGVTPEAATLMQATGGEAVPGIRLTAADLAAAWQDLNSAGDAAVDLVSLGNPHFSLTEIRALAALCRGRTRNPAVAVIVTCGRAVYDQAAKEGVLEGLDSFGVRFVTDTCWCMITDPLIPPAAQVIMTTSGKYAHYGPGLTGRRFRFGSLAACVDAASL
ncbi:cis-3-hydroxy-L-proline dehydratase [Novispirillum itersonii]|uniref:cis-3-hydroxy-L-proline dehydratase n=1 Tax=Novispirillum itersonii TaxID=189 RepID=UPI00037E1266|nr:aconitase X [Novispirillum itersonii]